jgi:hypothetical protein
MTSPGFLVKVQRDPLQSGFMNVAGLEGKVVVLWLTDEVGESAAFSGTAHWDGSKLLLERTSKPQFEIRPEWYDRIQAVTNGQTRGILLGADYFLRLYVGDVPEGATASEYERTGLKWPE